MLEYIDTHIMRQQNTKENTVDQHKDKQQREDMYRGNRKK